LPLSQSAPLRLDRKQENAPDPAGEKRRVLRHIEQKGG